MTPTEATNEIRAEFVNEHMAPEFYHQVRFAGSVLAELGQDNTFENVARVMSLLDKHGIQGHAYTDYPKWVTNDRREKAVVNDEEHEKAFMARPESHIDGEPNPEHGHIDPQTGEFVPGVVSQTAPVESAASPDLTETAKEE